MHTDTVYCGDCQNVLGNTMEFPDECVALVYIDPPVLHRGELRGDLGRWLRASSLRGPLEGRDGELHRLDGAQATAGLPSSQAEWLDVPSLRRPRERPPPPPDGHHLRGVGVPRPHHLATNQRPSRTLVETSATSTTSSCSTSRGRNIRGTLSSSPTPSGTWTVV